ncbi:Plasmodium exported protein, unknown function [Plasmodium gaboni]|uniref:Uncharacterized protein n=1 Tax=Plasmodium gaboni TaxID=647221 RepID=A0ABY0KW18_9APIC|nr:Plasmodium exported protein, unknown function [Plasmodium gaboni]
MNKFFVFVIFILGLFNSNKIFYEKYFNISENGNKNNYYLIRRLCEICSNIDETTDKMLQTYMTIPINNENDNDIDTISNYNVKDKTSNYFNLLKQEIKDVQDDYIYHFYSLKNGSPIKSIQKIKDILEFYDNLFIDKILDLKIQNKYSPLLHLLILTLYEIIILCPRLRFILPIYFIPRFALVHKFDDI